MIHARWGGPSGIIHGWVPKEGNEALGWVPVCYPHSYPFDAIPEAEQADGPVTCMRCLKRMGYEVRVIEKRTVHITPRAKARR